MRGRNPGKRRVVRDHFQNADRLIWRAIVKVVFLSWPRCGFQKEFFYSFNVWVIGFAQLYA